MTIEEELRCYKALYLKYLIEKYEHLVLSNQSLLDHIEEYLDLCRKQITIIYNQLFETKIESYNIDWLDPHEINTFLHLTSELGMYGEAALGIDLRSLRDKEEE